MTRIMKKDRIKRDWKSEIKIDENDDDDERGLSEGKTKAIKKKKQKQILPLSEDAVVQESSGTLPKSIMLSQQSNNVRPNSYQF